MALEIRQVQKLAQQLVMTPQLQQAIKLLQLSRIELEEMISQELQENPALEEAPVQEAENREEVHEEGRDEVPEPPIEPVLNRELSTADKIGTLDWQEYMDTHTNSIHGSLTAEADREEGEGPPSWENTLTRWSSSDVVLVKVFSHEGGPSPSSRSASAVRDPWIELVWVSMYSCQSRVPILSAVDSSRLSTGSIGGSGTSSRPSSWTSSRFSASWTGASSNAGFSWSSCEIISSSSMRESCNSLIACCSCGVITSC